MTLFSSGKDSLKEKWEGARYYDERTLLVKSLITL